LFTTLSPVLEQLEAAGVYDPSARDADERRAVIELLASSGLDVDQVRSVLQADDPAGEAGFHLLFPGEHIPMTELAARADLSIDQLERISRAAGLPIGALGPDKLLFSDRDVPTFVIIKLGTALFGEEAVLQFVRVTGSAMAQLAEAAVALFVSRVAAPLEQQDASPPARLRAEVDATRMLAEVGRALDTVFRLHAATAIRRLSRAREGSQSGELARLAVGFVDLVGFTPLAASLGSEQLGSVFDRFERVAADVIADHDARMVKLIGDAVMFTAVDADAACEVALTLVEQFENDDVVTPRGALALGEMLVRSGDYYGPVVNLAARAADLAVPNEILVSESIAEHAGERFTFVPAGRRKLKGFPDPVALQTLGRVGVSWTP
jgi:adenylate cyclase